jgi:hypothetical protein
MMGPGRRRYQPGSVDFFAVYLVPEDQWYIIPYEAMEGRMTLHITPGGKRQKYGKYLEAWHLLMEEEERIEIQACVEESGELGRGEDGQIRSSL